ncbi:MAG: FAD-binding oxidoreductase [Beijerinckiaceae bacterium]
MAARAVYRSWGGQTVAPLRVRRPTSEQALQLDQGPWLAYGNGRSYGDSCLPGSDAAVIDMRSFNRVLAFDRSSGVLRAEAGLMLGDLIDLTEPHGWFPAVVPGTRFVTLGGAVANDIHGKNHHRKGTFGRHVRALRLRRSSGGALECSPENHPDFFAATIGGMGLTGVATEIEMQLMPVGSADIVEEAVPLEGLADFFRLAPDCEQRFEYVVAWIDSLARGSALGRGVLLCGNHAEEPSRRRRGAIAGLSVPLTPPVSVIRTATLKAFNALYRWRALSKPGPRLVPRNAFFFPLDAIGNWNRLYGPRGLRQHQSVIPLASAELVIAGMLEAAQKADHGSFLTVLKLFGDLPSPGMLSFPVPGATLTLDFPYRGAATDRLLADLDARVLAAGGRVNPYKDARIDAATHRASFPGTDSFRAFIDPGARSGMSARIGLTAQPASLGEAA